MNPLAIFLRANLTAFEPDVNDQIEDNLAWLVIYDHFRDVLLISGITCFRIAYGILRRDLSVEVRGGRPQPPRIRGR